jgi:uncharacterized protein YjbI with pentapeptide repeats
MYGDCKITVPDATETLVIDLSNPTGVDLSGVRLSNANLSWAVLAKADLNNASLDNVNLQDALLADADLYKADLRNADLSNANLTGANLGAANLRGVTGVTREELEEQACNVLGATMPDGSKSSPISMGPSCQEIRTGEDDG